MATFPVTPHGAREAGRTYRTLNAAGKVLDGDLWASLHGRDITAGVLDHLNAYECGRTGEVIASWAIIKAITEGVEP